MTPSDRASTTSPAGPPRPGRILVTGATGYVGGRLVRALERRGWPVRCLARQPAILAPRVRASTEVVAGDAVRDEGLDVALRDIDTAYYLIHSLGGGRGFEEADRRAARNFAAAARAAGVSRIIYLGGLVDESRDLSPHLRSRVEVGRLLRDSGVPVIELRASIVVGPGSLSFELIRAIVERLPVLLTPRWVSTPAQPIGIDDLLAYLLEASSLDPAGSPVFEIGGADRMSYGDLMRETARQRGLRRIMLPVPVLTPRLSSLWLGLVTPLYARVGRALIDSIRHPTVVRSDAARHAFTIAPSDVRTAIARALESEEREFAETRWFDALSAAGRDVPSFGGVRMGPRLIDSREIAVPVPAARAFEPIRRIGGTAGWYAHDRLWQLRGWLDLLVGGVGMRRGRRSPDRLVVGDPLDCWRVTELEPDRLLRLTAEMRLPGRAWLEFAVRGDGSGSRIRQTAIFEPRGLAGRAYWYAIYPLHALVFRGMLKGIARRAQNTQRNAPVEGPARPVAGARRREGVRTRMPRLAHRRIGHRAGIVVLALACLAAEPAPVARGDAAWERRAEGERAGRPAPEPIRAALSAYEAALAAQPESLGARWKLLRALHFAGEFAAAAEAERRGRFERALEVSQAGLARLERDVDLGAPLHDLEPARLRSGVDDARLARTDVARLYFWSAINWGAWARSVGLLGAVREGVANRLHDYTRVTLALEPDYDEGGAYRLLGRLHAELPRVPFVSAWVDRAEAIPLVERAYALAPANPGNRLLLGLTLLDLAPSRRAEALDLLRQVEALTPRADMRIEDLAMREEARERLAEEAPGRFAARRE
jgi:uncharacterized protein YbjT (DUF2867 family)/tetratricopeptide (TPR) repeat protein